MTSLADLAVQEFVSLTTYRRSGAAISVPVWIAAGPGLTADPAAGALVITTTRRSGKVKRIRNDPRVQLTPCDRRGRVAPGAPAVAGLATIVEDPDEVRRLRAAIRAKYGSRMKVTAADEGLDEDEPTRVILRVEQRADPI